MVKAMDKGAAARGTVRSMTGFATRRGATDGWEWVWDMRAVNGRGLDLRLRLPEALDGLEQAARAAVGQTVTRGNVTLSLRLGRVRSEAGLAVAERPLEAALRALIQVEAAAGMAGLALRPASAAEIVALRGVLATDGDGTDDSDVAAALRKELAPLIAAFDAARAAEGTALAGVIGAQIDRIAALTAEARAAADARRPTQEAALKDNLARVLAGAAEADPARIAQELALLTVKADVAEELDRLTAHVAAARALLAEGGAIGRKFDFLMQEFMREANTLCSKSGNVELTRIGLDLKTVIDQTREQVQNVE